MHKSLDHIRIDKYVLKWCKLEKFEKILTSGSSVIKSMNLKKTKFEKIGYKLTNDISRKKKLTWVYCEVHAANTWA